MSPETLRTLRSRIERLDHLPTVPTVMAAVIDLMRKSLDEVEIEGLVELVQLDKAIALQCLRIANSPLHGGFRTISTIRAAIVALGVRRVRDILLSCSLAQAFPPDRWLIDPIAFWEHSIGCAMVSRFLAQKIGYDDPEQVYAAGLLHDVGEAVNTMLLPREFRSAVDVAMAESLSPYDAEKAVLGFTHCDTGALLAEHWNLPAELIDTIRWHHEVERASIAPEIVSIVSLADLLCRVRGLGYGFEETLHVDLVANPAWGILARRYTGLNHLDLARFTFELDGFAGEVSGLVGQLLGH